MKILNFGSLNLDYVYKVNHMTKSVTIENRDYIREPQRSKKQEAVVKEKEMSMPLRPGSSESQKVAAGQ